MNLKKILLIAAVVGAFAFVAAPKSEAHVSIGIGLGFPIAYPVVGYGYPYSYGYPYYGAYGYNGYRRPFIYRRPVVVIRNGHRFFRHR